MSVGSPNCANATFSTRRYHSRLDNWDEMYGSFFHCENFVYARRRGNNYIVSASDPWPPSSLYSREYGRLSWHCGYWHYIKAMAYQSLGRLARGWGAFQSGRKKKC